MRPPVRLGVGPQLLLPVLSSVVNGVQQLEPVVHNHRLLHWWHKAESFHLLYVRYWKRATVTKLMHCEIKLGRLLFTFDIVNTTNSGCEQQILTAQPLHSVYNSWDDTCMWRRSWSVDNSCGLKPSQTGGCINIAERIYAQQMNCFLPCPIERLMPKCIHHLFPCRWAGPLRVDKSTTHMHLQRHQITTRGL